MNESEKFTSEKRFRYFLSGVSSNPGQHKENYNLWDQCADMREE